MSVKRKCKVVMFPTNEKASNLFIIKRDDFYKPEKNLLSFSTVGGKIHSNDRYQPQNIYILSDDEIKEGDYYIDSLVYPKLLTEPFQMIGYFDEKKTIIQSKSGKTSPVNTSKKVIATTDSSLMVGFSNKLLNSYLPQPSQVFIEKFVDEYNKGNTITDVLVEYETPYVAGNYSNKCSICSEVFYNTDKLGFVCTKHQYLKVNPKDSNSVPIYII